MMTAKGPKRGRAADRASNSTARRPNDEANACHASQPAVDHPPAQNGTKPVQPTSTLEQPPTTTPKQGAVGAASLLYGTALTRRQRSRSSERYAAHCPEPHARSMQTHNSEAA